jgi:AsmA protein
MKKALKVFSIVVVVILSVLAALPFFISINNFKPVIESKLGGSLGRKVDLGDLSLSIFKGSLSAANLSIADDPAFSSSPFLTAKKMSIRVEMMPLILSRRLNVTGIAIDEPSIILLSTQNGPWNVSSLGRKNSSPDESSGGAAPDGFSVAELKITDGRLQIGEAHSSAKPMVIEKVNLTIKNFSAVSQVPFRLTAVLPGAGEMEIEGKAGPMATENIPVQAGLKVRNLDLGAMGADPALGLGGIGNLEGTLDSNGRTARVTGNLDLEKFKFSPKGTPASRPVKVKVATDYELKKGAGVLSKGDISIGKAAARLTGKYRTGGDSPTVDLKFDAPAMPVDEIVAVLPALGVMLPAGSSLKGGTLSADFGLTGPLSRLVTAGPARMENTSLEAFNLGAMLSVLSVLGGKPISSKDTAIQNANLEVRLASDGALLSAVNVTVPAIGELKGAGTIDPQSVLHFQMSVQMAGTSAAIPFLIEGTAAKPKIVPDSKGMINSALQQAISGKDGSQADSLIKGIGGLFKKKPK